MANQYAVTVYTFMTKAELERECKRLEEWQHKYARHGLAVLASSYAGKLVTASLELSTRR